MTGLFDASLLRVADTLFYTPSDPVVGVLIAVKTYKWLSHVEVYAGDGKCLGARITGVDYYPVRVDRHLVCVRRPLVKAFDLEGAKREVEDEVGLPYEVGGFFSFFNPWRVRQHTTRICSPVVRAFLRGGGAEVFNPSATDDQISPADLWRTGLLKTVWFKGEAYRSAP